MTTKNQSGIYRIKNTETGVMYIGRASQSFADRWGDHRSALRGGYHRNPHLQNSYNRHGPSAFEFKVLEVIPRGDMSDKEFNDYLNEREIILIDEHDTLKNGYNKTEGGGGMMGYETSEATKAKMSKSLKGRNLSEETKAKISKAMRGRTSPNKGIPMSEEQKAKLSEVNKGKTLRAEHIANIRAANSKPKSAETRAKISAAKKGKPLSAEHKANLSAAGMGNTNALGNKLSAETRAKMSKARKGHKVTPETRAKLSKATKAYYARKRKQEPE